MNPRLAASCTFALVLGCVGCTPVQTHYLNPAALPEQWRTKAERTDYAETARYDETVALCRRVATASADARYMTFGTSGEGRPLPLLILSREHAFSPRAARRSDKVLFLINNCIHPGECVGQDASLALVRDILITGEHAALLDHVNLLIIPIFNVDGHERFGPHNRINQNGPKEMGWRTTATNLNLNRDFAKADAVEMKAWLRLWNTWQPDLLYDIHSTDGHDHRYHLMYAGTTEPTAAQSVVDWIRDTLYPGVIPAVEAAGWNTFPYSWPRDRKDLAAGVGAAGNFSPRYSTGYGAACNRPAILIEAHARKPYRQRVGATYAVLLETLRTLNRSPRALKEAVCTADQRCTATRGGERDGEIPLSAEAVPGGRPVIFKAFDIELYDSEITGNPVIRYTKRPVDVETRLFDQFALKTAVNPPAAYLVPPQWTNVIERLTLHNIPFFRLAREVTLEVESYRFKNVTFAATPYEGRQMPSYTATPARERRTFAAGTAVIPMDQSRAKLAAHLLEPAGPDSFVAWGLFNTVFERKEYTERYVMEPLARQMLAADPALRAEFEAKLKANEEFAKNPGRRLQFFYERSPYYDQRHNVYPVARLLETEALRHLPRQ